MNREFIEGIVRGLGNRTLEASLEPTPGQCCVVLRQGARERGSAPDGVPDPAETGREG
jgi:hypothetical protein